MFYMAEMRAAAQVKSFCVDFIPWSLWEDFQSITVLTSKARCPAGKAVCPNSAIICFAMSFHWWTWNEHRMLEECRVETTVCYSAEKALFWLRLCLVCHSNTPSSSALCSTLDFFCNRHGRSWNDQSQSIPELSFAVSVVDNSHDVSSKLSSSGVKFFCVAITFSTPSKSLLDMKKSS